MSAIRIPSARSPRAIAALAEARPADPASQNLTQAKLQAIYGGKERIFTLGVLTIGHREDDVVATIVAAGQELVGKDMAPYCASPRLSSLAAFWGRLLGVKLKGLVGISISAEAPAAAWTVVAGEVADVADWQSLAFGVEPSAPETDRRGAGNQPGLAGGNGQPVPVRHDPDGDEQPGTSDGGTEGDGQSGGAEPDGNPGV